MNFIVHIFVFIWYNYNVITAKGWEREVFMEEINLKELFEYFKERLTTIIIIVLAVIFVGTVYSLFLKTPQYKSQSTIILVNNTQSTTTSDLQLNKNLVKTYSKVVKSRTVVQKTIDNLALDYSYEQVVNKISVTSDTDTEVITISATDPDKSVAADLTNELVKVFTAEVNAIYNLQNISVIDPAEEQAKPYNINLFKDYIIYLAIGFVLALAIVFVIYYFDTTIKSADEVEQKFGIPIFGVIPKVKHREK